MESQIVRVSSGNGAVEDVDGVLLGVVSQGQLEENLHALDRVPASAPAIQEFLSEFTWTDDERRLLDPRNWTEKAQ